jgi:hypothetical protein
VHKDRRRTFVILKNQAIPRKECLCKTRISDPLSWVACASDEVDKALGFLRLYVTVSMNLIAKFFVLY